jgi:hypothetical protein
MCWTQWSQAGCIWNWAKWTLGLWVWITLKARRCMCACHHSSYKLFSITVLPVWGTAIGPYPMQRAGFESPCNPRIALTGRGPIWEKKNRLKIWSVILEHIHIIYLQLCNNYTKTWIVPIWFTETKVIIKDILFILQDAINKECTRLYSNSVTGEIRNSLKENSRSLDLLINEFLVCKII